MMPWEIIGYHRSFYDPRSSCESLVDGCSQLTAHRSLLIAHRSLLTAHCSLLIAHSSSSFFSTPQMW